MKRVTRCPNCGAELHLDVSLKRVRVGSVEEVADSSDRDSSGETAVARLWGRSWAKVVLPPLLVVLALFVWYLALLPLIEHHSQGPGRRPIPRRVVSDSKSARSPSSSSGADTSDLRTDFELTVRASGRTWICVAVDGVLAVDLTLDEGDEMTWSVCDQAELTVGNGQVLEVHIDGMYVGPAGSDRRLVEGLVITSEGMMW
jgi:hypothetical protein